MTGGGSGTGALTLLLGLACAGAALGRSLRLPMWPVTGSILGAATAPLAGLGAVPPGWWSTAGQILVGSGVGSMVGRNFLASVRRVSVPGAVVVVLIVALGAGIGAALTLGGVLGPTPALLGSIPGGVGEMVAAAAGLGGDSGLVAGMHLIRLVVVLSALPLLLRWARGLEGRDG
ncbi:AbrB family transcriptional regulator [Streptomyces marispadix]|uniref:AbrB family transcriptional regulator n=1 Tax=Streptomyces marispadix TaxID=2922868 RepID=UPI0024027D4F|nr:AbrB family transcriptional regulator [Streptomyces marispadix]